MRDDDSRVEDVDYDPDAEETDGAQMATSSSLKHLMLVGEKAARSPDVPRWEREPPSPAGWETHGETAIGPEQSLEG